MKNSVLTLAIATMMAAVSVQAQEHASSVHKHNQGSNASVGLGLINRLNKGHTAVACV